MSERFELIGEQSDISGHLRLTFGFGPDDPLPFVITLTALYVARALAKMAPVTFQQIEKYAYDRGSPRYGIAGKRRGTIEPYSSLTRSSSFIQVLSILGRQAAIKAARSVYSWWACNALRWQSGAGPQRPAGGDAVHPGSGRPANPLEPLKKPKPGCAIEPER
jgi:hypothetical protein